jgi:nicotinamidase-related amidase
VKTPKTAKMPIPDLFKPDRAADIWEPKMSAIEDAARQWAADDGVEHHGQDAVKVALVPIDVQLSFCNPNFELFVGGRSGTGAIEDCKRTARFIYENLHVITKIFPTLDTHVAIQIFFRSYWINEKGEKPVGNATVITLDDVIRKKWRPDPAIALPLFSGNAIEMERYTQHYVRTLTDAGKYPLTVWDYHCELGTIGHTMVPLVFEAIWFHSVARRNQIGWKVKGESPYTEAYGPWAPEVTTDHRNRMVVQPDVDMIDLVLTHDVIAFLGQAKSHCVAWAIDQVLNRIAAKDPSLAKKVYIIEDCTSPVVVPGIIDFTDKADKAIERFRDAGMHVVTSLTPIVEWPDTPFTK